MRGNCMSLDWKWLLCSPGSGWDGVGWSCLTITPPALHQSLDVVIIKQILKI